MQLAALAALLALLPDGATVSGFSASLTTSSLRSSSPLFYHPEKFERAVRCVETRDLCDVDELMDLSKELEEYQGCFYEKGAKACEKEILDRKDLAEVLIMQSELRERTRYVKEGNLFAYDVQEDHNMHNRDDFFEKIISSLDT